ncbi:MAG: hypothetical protein L0H64_17875 [Pseudonocardia sp.]|nr:hypothetical protein [Pseudonocardia sp.]
MLNMITMTTNIVETHGTRPWVEPVADARVYTRRPFVPMLGGLDSSNSTGVSEVVVGRHR